MLGIALLGVLAAVLVGFFASRISSGVAKQMRSDVFRKVESFSNTEFDKFSTASLITRTTNDVTQVQMLISMGLRLMCYAPIMGVGGIIFALQKSVSLSWIIALAVIVLLGLGHRTFKRCNAEIQELAAFDGQIEPRQPREFERHACGTRVYE